MDLGLAMRAHREAARMTQAHLAAAAGVSRDTVVRAETGRGVGPESLRAIGAVLGIPARDLDAHGSSDLRASVVGYLPGANPTAALAYALGWSWRHGGPGAAFAASLPFGDGCLWQVLEGGQGLSHLDGIAASLSHPDGHAWFRVGEARRFEAGWTAARASYSYPLAGRPGGRPRDVLPSGLRCGRCGFRRLRQRLVEAPRKGGEHIGHAIRDRGVEARQRARSTRDRRAVRARQVAVVGLASLMGALYPLCVVLHGNALAAVSPVGTRGDTAEIGAFVRQAASAARRRPLVPDDVPDEALGLVEGEHGVGRQPRAGRVRVPAAAESHRHLQRLTVARTE